MNREQMEELLSRGLDGDLSPDESAELHRMMASDPELKKTASEWADYARLLREEAVPPAPSPEAAWADVQRAIRLGAAENADQRTIVFGWRLGWAGAMLAIVLLGFSTIAVRQIVTSKHAAGSARGEKDVEVEYVETDLPGASPMVYEDAETGWTVIWVAGAGNGSAEEGT